MKLAEEKNNVIEIPIEEKSSDAEEPHVQEVVEAETEQLLENLDENAATPEEPKPDPLQESEERFKRLAADFANYKRRVEAERNELLELLEARLLSGILTIYDDFRRLSEHTAGADEQLTQGIKVVQSKWQSWLTSENVKIIAPVGEPFDPHLHDALMQQNVSDPEQEGKVLHVIESGYKRRDKVLRHAKVIVGHYQAEERQTETETTPTELQEETKSGDSE